MSMVKRRESEGSSGGINEQPHASEQSRTSTGGGGSSYRSAYRKQYGRNAQNGVQGGGDRDARQRQNAARQSGGQQSSFIESAYPEGTINVRVMNGKYGERVIIEHVGSNGNPTWRVYLSPSNAMELAKQLTRKVAEMKGQDYAAAAISKVLPGAGAAQPQAHQPAAPAQQASQPEVMSKLSDIEGEIAKLTSRIASFMAKIQTMEEEIGALVRAISEKPSGK